MSEQHLDALSITARLHECFGLCRCPGNIAGGLMLGSAIPVSMRFGFTGMLNAGISGNLMSLGAIDFGLIVDGSVVMIENIVRRMGLARKQGLSRDQAILEAGREVARPIFFAVLIIILVYLPIVTLEGVEGKMFRPMAWTVVLALIGSLILALTLMPALASRAVPRARIDLRRLVLGTVLDQDPVGRERRVGRLRPPPPLRDHRCTLF